MNKLVLLLICFCTVSSLADDLSQDELYYDIFSGVVYDMDQSLNDLFDMQGRVLAYGKTNGSVLSIRLPHKGAFLLSVGSRLHRIMAR